MKRYIFRFAIGTLGLLVNINSSAQDTIRISDLGLKPDTRQNAVLIVQKALELCKTKNSSVLVFPKGLYDFCPQYTIEKMYYESNTDVIPLRRCAILIEGMEALTIDCMGSDFVFHDRIVFLSLEVGVHQVNFFLF